MASRVTMTELRGNLGKLVNRAAFGGERIVLVSHGKPVAAIVGLADLERLRDSGDRSPEGSSADRTLSSARELRRRIRRWQEEHGIAATDVVDTLAGLRGDRDGELSGLR